MDNYSFYLLWLPKYFDEYYDINQNNEAVENHFLFTLKKFLKSNTNISNCKLKIYDKKIPIDIDNSKGDIVSFHREKNSIGYWGKIEFEVKNSNKKAQIVFNEFGFYYFEFIGNKEVDRDSILEDKEIIKSFFTREDNYPLLTDNQEDVLKETFLNDHLNYRDFNRKQHYSHKKVRLENFILESLYKADENDVDIDGKTIKNKIKKLQEYQYQVKKDEYYDFQALKESKRLQPLKEKIISLFKVYNSNYNLDANTHKKIILDVYEEQAMSSFLTTVVSARYFDRITKSIRKVRDGLTGKIIFMTPQDTKVIDKRYKNNIVFHRWSEEKIENYVQLLISKKPLFMKIDNALKSAYYVTIGNVTSLGYINEKEDISQLLYYHEWKSLLEYFSETTESLNTILHLYHSNRTYQELEEIKHYESNNHDKDDIDLLIKSNENKLGTTEDSKTYMMIIAFVMGMLVVIPDIIGSIGSFPKQWLYSSITDEWTIQALWALTFYGSLFLLLFLFFRKEFGDYYKIIKEYRRNQKGKDIIYIKSSPDDFDILEHRSNTPVRTYSFDKTKPTLIKVSINYQEHVSTHRFVRYIEQLNINSCNWSKEYPYKLLPEIATLEGMMDKNNRLYRHIKKYRTTKFSVNRVDKTKIKITMRYRVNRIKIEDFLKYYAEHDSYISFYKDCCINNGECNKNKCHKINSDEVIKKLKEDFKNIDAEFSFVAIYSFSLISKTLDYSHEKNFELYKDSFRVYFHIDKYPIDYYNYQFELRNNKNVSNSSDLKPYDAISEMVYLLFLGRFKGFNNNMKG